MKGDLDLDTLERKYQEIPEVTSLIQRLLEAEAKLESAMEMQAELLGACRMHEARVARLERVREIGAKIIGILEADQPPRADLNWVMWEWHHANAALAAVEKSKEES